MKIVREMLNRRNQTTSEKAGAEPAPKRARHDEYQHDRFVQVDIDDSDDAAPLVNQLESTVLGVVDDVSEIMRDLMSGLGFRESEMSPLCKVRHKTAR